MDRFYIPRNLILSYYSGNYCQASLMKCAVIVFSLFGILLRLCSYTANAPFAHGDVHYYALMARFIIEDGEFTVGNHHTASQYQPLWPLIGAAVACIFNINNTYKALRIASLMIGLILPVTIFYITKKLLGEKSAYVATILIFSSYLLSDFSGNGAPYTLLALLYIVTFYFLVQSHYLPAGLCAGLAYLTNHMAIMLLPAALVLILKQERKLSVLKFIVPFIIIALFWWTRNYNVYGNPFFSDILLYFAKKTGVAFVSYSSLTGDDFYKIANWIAWWFPRNLYFINRKLFIIVPVYYVAFLFSAIQPYRNRAHNVALIILFFQCILFALYPTVHFRYFVVLVPFIIVLGADYLVKNWNITLIPSFILYIIITIMAFFATPTHTMYYNGLLTTDLFGRRGEYEFIQNYDYTINRSHHLYIH